MSLRTIFVIVSAGALASATSLSSLSQACQNSLNTLTDNAAASSCVAANQLLNIFLASPDDSLISTTTNWLNQFCGAAPECSADVIAQVTNEISVACGDDLGKLGVTSDDVATVLPYIQKYWSTAKEIVCLADTSKNEFCGPVIASNIQTALHTNVSVNWVYNEITGSISSDQYTLPANATCVPCTQAALVKVEATELTNVVDIKGFASRTCGEDFAAASAMPSNIVVGIGSSAPKAKANSASSITRAGSLGVFAAVLAVWLL